MSAMENFINAFHGFLLKYVEYLDKDNFDSHTSLNWELNGCAVELTEEQKQLFYKLYKPDIITQHPYTMLNNCTKTAVAQTTLFSDIDSMVMNLYEDKNKEEHLPKVMEELLSHQKNFTQEYKGMYMEYENEDLKYVTYFDTEKKNAIKFQVDGIEEIKKLVYYDHKNFSIEFYRKYETPEDKLKYFNDNIKYVHTPSKYMEEYILMDDLNQMAITNYM
jgi:hypothetical protein